MGKCKEGKREEKMEKKSKPFGKGKKQKKGK